MHTLPPKRGPSAPRPTTYLNSAPARLRDCTGLSKRDFAERCGIPFNTFKSIESGTRSSRRTRNLTAYHADLMAAATGASAAALMRNELKVADESREFTARDFQIYDRALQFTDAWRSECFERLRGRSIDFLTEASEKEGLDALNRFLAFAKALDDLEKAFDAVRPQRGKKKPTNVEWLTNNALGGPTPDASIAKQKAIQAATTLIVGTAPQKPARRGSRQPKPIK